jgi:hypothetical protein
LTGAPDVNYTIQGSTDLLDWISIITNAAPYTLIDTNAGYGNKFYRGVYVPTP